MNDWLRLELEPFYGVGLVRQSFKWLGNLCRDISGEQQSRRQHTHADQKGIADALLDLPEHFGFGNQSTDDPGGI